MISLDPQYITDLVIFARNGDADAFAELYMATCQKQYHFAYNYLKDEELAKDAIRRTYVLALKHIAALTDTDLFLSWLNQITFRVCLRLRKKSQKPLNEMIVYDYEDLEQMPPEDLEPEEYRIRIRGQELTIRQVLSLPFTESQVLILRYHDQLKLRDISRLMDLSTLSVRRYLANGCRQLQQLAKSAGKGEDYVT